jgi:hypothetical protein
MLRNGIRNAEKAAQSHVDSFRTLDGRRFVYAPQTVGIELFLYACDLIRDPYVPDAPPPPEPPFVEAVRNAEDPNAVIERFQSGFIDLRSMVYNASSAGREPGEAIEDLSD